MKISMTLTSGLSAAVFTLTCLPVSANHLSAVDVLNNDIEACFQATQFDGSSKSKPLSKRACNRVLRTSFASRENIAIAFHNRGIINLAMGKTKNALEDFQAALKRNPDLTMSKAAIAQIRMPLADDSSNVVARRQQSK